MSVHGTISMPGKTPTSEEISQIEVKISENVTDISRSLEKPPASGFPSELVEMVKQNICCVGASPTGSVIMFFLCTTFQSVVSLKEMMESGRLKEIMERVFNFVLESSNMRIALKLKCDKDEFKNFIDEARRTSE